LERDFQRITDKVHKPTEEEIGSFIRKNLKKPFPYEMDSVLKSVSS